MTQTAKPLKKLEISAKTQELIDMELQYCAGGFQPLPAFFVRGKGCKLWVKSKARCQAVALDETDHWRQDVDGKEYLDFIAMFSAVNTGQCNPRITKAVIESMEQSTETLSLQPREYLLTLCTRE